MSRNERIGAGIALALAGYVLFTLFAHTDLLTMLFRGCGGDLPLC